MNRVPVQSSTVKSIGYDQQSGAMHVEFLNGSIYSYEGVTANDYRAAMSGQFSWSKLKPRLDGKPYARVKRAVTDQL